MYSCPPLQTLFSESRSPKDTHRFLPEVLVQQLLQLLDLVGKLLELGLLLHWNRTAQSSTS